MHVVVDRDKEVVGDTDRCQQEVHHNIWAEGSAVQEVHAGSSHKDSIHVDWPAVVETESREQMRHYQRNQRNGAPRQPDALLVPKKALGDDELFDLLEVAHKDGIQQMELLHCLHCKGGGGDAQVAHAGLLHMVGDSTLAWE